MEQDIFQLPTLASIQKQLEPIHHRLEKIESLVQKPLSEKTQVKYYRNQDLKRIFGLSNNTIIKYRETGVLPYTKLGDVYLCEVKAIQQILERNKMTPFV